MDHFCVVQLTKKAKLVLFTLIFYYEQLLGVFLHILHLHKCNLHTLMHKLMHTHTSLPVEQQERIRNTVYAQQILLMKNN